MKSRRSFGLGILVGVGATVVVAALLGMGRGAARGPDEGEWFVTSGQEGRVAYLWRHLGGNIHYVSQGVAPDREMDEKVKGKKIGDN